MIRRAMITLCVVALLRACSSPSSPPPAPGEPPPLAGYHTVQAKAVPSAASSQMGWAGGVLAVARLLAGDAHCY